MYNRNSNRNRNRNRSFDSSRDSSSSDSSICICDSNYDSSVVYDENNSINDDNRVIIISMT